MTNQELQDKAIDIKGKKYVMVKDRIVAFNDDYKNGCIRTKLVDGGDDVTIKAYVYPDMKNPDRFFTGYASEMKGTGTVNKTAALENAETSAVGRALAMMGIGVIDSVASVDEMAKAGVSTTPAKDHGVCKDCGAINAWSARTSKPYCSKLCWKNPKLIKDEEPIREEEQEVISPDDIPF